MFRVIRLFSKFCFLSALVLISAHYILLQGDYNNLKPQVAKYFKTHYKFDCAINGDIEFVLLPLPSLQIKDVLLQDKANHLTMKLPKTTLYISPKIVIDDKFSGVKHIQTTGPTIRFKSSEKEGKKALYELLTNKILENPGFNFVFEDVAFLLLDEKTNVPVSEYRGLDIEISFKHENFEFNVNSKKEQQKLLFSAKGLDKKLQPEKINIDYHKGMIKASAEMKIDDSKKDYFLKGTSEISLSRSHADKKRLPNKNSGYNIVSDIYLTDHYVVLNNIKSSAGYIDISAGEITYDFIGDSLISNLEIDSINIDKFLNELDNPKSHKKHKLKNLKRILFEEDSLSFVKYIRNSSLLKINKIILHEEEINNFKLDLKFWWIPMENESIISLNELSMDLPGESKLLMKGILNNSKGSFFDGDITFYGKRFTDFFQWFNQDKNILQKYNGPFIAKSDLILMPYVLHLNNLELATDKIHGVSDLTLFDYNNTEYFFDGNIFFSKLHLDSTSLKEDLHEFMYNLFAADFDSTGKAFFEKTNNFNFIRQQGGYSNLSLEASDIKLQNLTLDSVIVNYSLQKDKLFIKQIDTKGKDINFHGDFKITTNSFVPQYDLDLHINQIGESFWQESGGLLDNLRKKYLQENKNVDASVVNAFNFFGINNVAGVFQIGIDQFSFNTLQLNNLDFSGESSFGNIKLKSLGAEFLDGNISVNGDISTINPVYAVKLGLGIDNINPSKIIGYLIANEDPGYLSSAGYINSRGANFAEMIENMDGSFKVDAKAIDHKGFDLDEFVGIAGEQSSYDNKMDRVKYYSQYGDTVFDTLSGNIKIDNGIAKAENMVLSNKLVNGLLSFVYSLPKKQYKTVANFTFSPVKNKSVTVVLNADEKTSIMDVTDFQKYLSEIK